MLRFAVGSISILFLSQIALSAGHTGELPPAPPETDIQVRPEERGGITSSKLRKSLLKCAEKLEVLQPSKDYVEFKVSGGYGYVVLSHDTGEYILPLDGEKLASGSYQAFVNFPDKSGRNEKVLLTMSFPENATADQVTVRTTVPIVSDQNPSGLDELMAVQVGGPGSVHSDDERQFLQDNLSLQLENDLASKIGLLSMRVPEVQNIFAEPIKTYNKAREDITPDLTEEETLAAIQKRMNVALNGFSMEQEFSNQTGKALTRLKNDTIFEQEKLQEAIQACSNTHDRELNKFAKAQEAKVQEEAEINLRTILALKLLYPKYVKQQLSQPINGGPGLNSLPLDTLNPDMLTGIHDTVAQSIVATYLAQHDLISSGIRNEKKAAK